MEMFCCLVYAVVVTVVFLALLKLFKAYSESGSANATVSVDVDGENAGGAKHINHNGIRQRRSRYARFIHCLKGFVLTAVCAKRFALFQTERRCYRGRLAVFFS